MLLQGLVQKFVDTVTFLKDFIFAEFAQKGLGVLV